MYNHKIRLYLVVQLNKNLWQKFKVKVKCKIQLYNFAKDAVLIKLIILNFIMNSKA